MHLAFEGLSLFHDVQESFSELLRRALHGGMIGVALGPIYEKDPAEELMFPFVRADVETGWSDRPRHPDGVPRHILEQARGMRDAAVREWERAIVPYGPMEEDLRVLNEWARAGLVHEVCRRRGINVKGLGRVHITWKLRGTITGRFGAHAHPGNSLWPNGFHPHTIPEEKRYNVVPSAAGRMICALDFRAIDLCSMLAVLPALKPRYDDAHDLHDRTAEILFGEVPMGEARDSIRSLCKTSIFIHAYGGDSALKDLFEEKLPELNAARSWPHGDFARIVQRTSAEAFRAGLSEALPMLLGDDIVPMFTVHDELVLDVRDDQVENCLDVAVALERGATRSIGVDYFVSPKFGLNYGSAKAA